MNFFLILFLCLIQKIAIGCSEDFLTLKKDQFVSEIVKYSPEKETTPSIVLIIPPTGGMNFIDKSYAKNICEKGQTSIILKNWTNDNEYNLELEIHHRFYKRAQKAIELVLESFPTKEFSILGTSVGGLHASIATARHEQIKKALLIVSGGGIASIIANTSQDILVDAKKKRFSLYKFKDNNHYISELKKVLPFEPLAMNVDKSKKLAMIISNNDSVVPTINQLRLIKHWNLKILDESSLGHTATVVYTWLFNSDKVINFF